MLRASRYASKARLRSRATTVCARAAWSRPIRPRQLVWGRTARWAATATTDTADEELNPETVSYLTDRSGAREVYLVGTAHVSEGSADDVRKTIRIAKPHGIMVELCAQRARKLREGTAPKTPKEVAQQMLSDLQSQGRAPPGFHVEFLLKLGFASFYAFLRQCGMVPGIEFQAALQEAERLRLPVCMGDQEIDETMSRLRASLSSISMARLMHAPPVPPELMAAAGGSGALNLKVSVEELKNRKQIAVLRDYVTSLAPELMDVMVGQRDRLMTTALLQECPIGRTVAVVGMAHMDGIEDEWRSRGGEVFLHGNNSLSTAR